VRDSQPASGGVEPNPADLFTSAIEYAAAGWLVFPLVPRGKTPLYPSAHAHGDPLRATCRGQCGRMGHGLYDATSDFERIAELWGRTPLANIGIATGRPGPDVLDVDVKHGAPGMRALDELRRTPLIDGAGFEVRTWSGGMHLYFAGSADQGNGRLPTRGIDFRSTGGYVVAPPSVVEGCPYVITATGSASPSGVRWSDIRDRLAPPRRYLPAPPRGDGGRQGSRGLIKYMEGQKQGNRNSTLYWCAHRMAEAGADELDFVELARAAVSTGLREGEVRASIASARGMTR
jgi:hypothetical protein